MPNATLTAGNVVERILERAAAQPSHPAIVTSAESDQILSYRELAAGVEQRAAALIADGRLNPASAVA